MAVRLIGGLNICPTSVTNSCGGDDIDLWGKLNYNTHRQEQDEQLFTEGYSTDNRKKHSRYENRTLNWEAGVQYTIHSHSHWNYRAAVGYYYKKSDVDNEMWRNQSPLLEDGWGRQDLTNTYSYVFTSGRVTPMAMVYYQRDNQKKQRSDWFSISIPMHIESQHLNYHSEHTDTSFVHRLVIPTPEMRYETTFNQGLNYLYINYNSSYFTPTMMRMVNTYWDADPLNIQIGNGNVKNSIQHRFVVNYKVGKKEYNQYLRFDGGLNIRQNKIVNGQIYDSHTGVTYYQYDNVSGDWDFWSQLTFGRMLDKQKRLWMETRIGAGYDHNVGIAAMLGKTTNSLEMGRVECSNKSVVSGWNLDSYALLRYKFDKLTLSSYIRHGMSWEHYSIPSRGQQSSLHITNVHYGLSGQYEFPLLGKGTGRGLQLATDFVLYTKRGYSDASLNTNDYVWNVSIAKSLLKNTLVVKLEGFDILNQLSNIYTTIDAQGVVEEWRNMVPSFVMLHLQWHFSRMPKK